MESDREKAKSAIVAREKDDPELGAALHEGKNLQLEILKETNRHDEAMRGHELGFFGRILGGESTAPTVIAALVVLLGFVTFVACLYAASQYPDHADFWAKQGERGLGVGAAALAYLFGRGSK